MIAEAEGGTLHIDEITEIPISMQTKLLRFLDTKKYTILGDTKEKYADVRIITSTNKEIALDDKKLKGYIWTCQADTNIYAIESQLSIQLENTILKINSSIGLKSEEPQSIKIINQNNSEYKVYQTIVQI